MGEKTDVTDGKVLGESRAQLELTRSQMSDTLSKIGDKLNPQDLMIQAKETTNETLEVILQHVRETIHEVTRDTLNQVHDATVGKFIRTLDDAAKNSRCLADQMAKTAKVVTRNLQQKIKENPIPAGLLALGILLVVVHEVTSSTKK